VLDASVEEPVEEPVLGDISKGYMCNCIEYEGARCHLVALAV
jgi:hypothetical protein